ncbi:MAG: hypothetical protein HOP12_08720, partial [Candidatus Eisenbacteria bacterium]|nr:hypothetical protein [Candidatus Eisenbacteria bacterium]
MSRHLPNPNSIAVMADRLAELLDEAPLAFLIGGSFARGEAVRDETGRSLSDVDAWWVAADERSRARVLARWRARQLPIRSVMSGLGFGAPLELSFVTPGSLAALPARPGTLELRELGVVVRGDVRVLSRIPAWRPRDISHEERLLLLENRSFELLAAREEVRTDATHARHRVLKVATELATSITLLADELPFELSVRVERARARLRDDPRLSGADVPALERLWAEAIAWRIGTPNAPRAIDELWRDAARGWVAVWQAVTEAAGLGRFADPLARVRALARRASLRRRLRAALGG